MTHTDYLKQIGTEIKIARIRKNLSRPQLVKLTGLSINVTKELLMF
jgi:transcriptional regulator with XRE-family HTH domain